MNAPVTIPLVPATWQDVYVRLGEVPLSRILLTPHPGFATEEDVLALAEAADKRLCELVDGVLVEKAMGFRESFLAGVLFRILSQFVIDRNLGIVTPADGMMRLVPGNVRIPDVSFIAWESLPGRRLPAAPVPHLAPTLAVEVLSASNTRKEMERKRQDLFSSGTRLFWEIEPNDRTISVYVSATDPPVKLGSGDVLVGGDIVPGFTLAIDEFFAELDRQG